jgi:NADH:ubiquinone oxidoreductase subunit 3 (subunit A)
MARAALFWERWSYWMLLFCTFVLLMTAMSNWAQSLDHRAPGGFFKLAGLMFMGAVSTGLQYSFNRSKVDILKEVKQVQLQVLELQASLRKDVDR